MYRDTPTIFVRLFASICVLFFITGISFGQKFDGVEKSRMKDMLKVAKNEIKKNYYDPNYHGIDLDDRFQKANDKLDNATSSGQALAIIAQTLVDFNDSHLYFVPPSTTSRVDYGWRVQIIGDKAYIVGVKPGSDAETKGVKTGDQLIAIDGFHPSRKELWKVQYYYNQISKKTKVMLDLQSPGSSEVRRVEVASQIKRQPQLLTEESFFRLGDDFYNEENDKHRFIKIGSTWVWRMPSFALEPADIDTLMGKFKGAESLIIDLRGNGGGYVKAMERMAGYFVEKEQTIAELKGRKPMDPMLAKPRSDGFKGKVAVLIDSESASASEIFARLMQLQGRGKVFGDISSGSVMQSIAKSQSMGTDSAVFYRISVTNADVIMTDGKSIEHVGVTPDVLVLTTPEDLRDGRDPVLVAALASFGSAMKPEEAGKLFPFFWKMN